jgi:hypothetical protein
MTELPDISDQIVLSMRGRKNRVDPHRPYAWLVEPERTAE